MVSVSFAVISVSVFLVFVNFFLSVQLIADIAAVGSNERNVFGVVVIADARLSINKYKNRNIMAKPRTG